jgi:hypothetical protein
LDEIQTKVFRVFLLAIHSHRYSFALRFLFLQTHATSYSFYSLVTLHCTIKEEGGKPGRKTILPSLPYGLRNQKASKDYAQAPQQICMFMSSASDYPIEYKPCMPCII